MSEDLIIPVYLNQRIVFDMLAMLEGGIARVTRVAASDRQGETAERRYGAEFGLSKALASLLTISVSGNRTRTSEEDQAVQVEEERVHTPASLFFRLRNQLKENGPLRDLDAKDGPVVHDLVEFTAALTPNPLLRAMSAFSEILRLSELFSDNGTATRTNTGPRRKSGSSQRSTPQDPSDLLRTQLQGFIDLLQGGNTVDLIASDVAGDYGAVITLEKEYLNDPTMADLVDGVFTVTGKIIRVVDRNASNRISLLRKTPLAVMPSALLEPMQGAFDQFEVGTPVITEVPGPAFQVIPIAIFA